MDQFLSLTEWKKKIICDKIKKKRGDSKEFKCFGLTLV